MEQFASSHPDDTPTDYDRILDAAEKVDHLPHSQAFEQIMYDNCQYRYSRFESQRPIVIGPRVFKSQFPEEVKSHLASSNSLTLDNLEVSYLFQPVDEQVEELLQEQTAKLKFEADGTDYFLNWDGKTTTMGIVKTDGSTCEAQLDEYVFNGLLASIVYADQYEDSSPEKALTLAEDPLLKRKTNDNELLESMIMTLGNTSGTSFTATSSLFSVGSKIIQANLLVRETPTVNSINNMISLSELTLGQATDSTLHQNEATLLPLPKLTNQYIELFNRDSFTPEAGNVVPELITSENSFFEWGERCQDFIGHIGPLLEKYETTA